MWPTRRLAMFFAAAALVGAAAAAFAQSVQATYDLRFGSIVAGGAPGTITISPLGQRTRTGGVTLVGSSYGNAVFVVSGTPDTVYVIGLPVEASLDGDDGSTHLTVDGFQSDPASTGSNTLDGNGEAIIRVGAALHVGANQARGSYSGSISVRVTYN